MPFLGPLSATVGTRPRRVGLVAAACVALLGAGALSPVEAGASPAHNPRGHAHITVQNRIVHVWGKAADPDAAGSTAVSVSFPRRGTTVLRADGRTHTFSHYFRLPVGNHFVQVVAGNVGPGAPVTLSRRWIRVFSPATRNPRGTERTRRQVNRVRIAGTAWDPDAPHAATEVRLVRNGRVVADGRTNAHTHRYAFGVRLRSGENFLRVVAVNRLSGTHNTRLPRQVFWRDPAWVLRYHGNRRIAAEMLPRYGWDAAQMRILDHMWDLESNWETRAANPSGAYGIPQAYPGSKMASAGADWRTNPRTQIRWGLSYIKQLYGSPAGAWNARETVGTY